MMPMRRYHQSWLPAMFDDFFDNDWMKKANATAPAINVIENDKEYKVEVAAPGMNKEDFNVHVDENGNLVIAMGEDNINASMCDGVLCIELPRKAPEAKNNNTQVIEIK